MRVVILAMLVWSVWYDDGTGLQRFHSAKHDWSDIPDKPGVQIVLVCEEPPYRRVIHGSDWYWINDRGIPRSSGNDGFPDGKWRPKPHPAARAGVTIDEARFEAYRLAALEDKTCAMP
jgi:hypothetical protein